jgi:hypothetical protein
MKLKTYSDRSSISTFKNIPPHVEIILDCIHLSVIEKSKIIEDIFIGVPLSNFICGVYFVPTDVKFYKQEILTNITVLKTILEFVNNEFKLTNLEVRNDLNDLSFGDLTMPLRRYIDSIDLKFEIIECSNKSDLNFVKTRF